MWIRARIDSLVNLHWQLPTSRPSGIAGSLLFTVWLCCEWKREHYWESSVCEERCWWHFNLQLVYSSNSATVKNSVNNKQRAHRRILFSSGWKLVRSWNQKGAFLCPRSGWNWLAAVGNSRRRCSYEKIANILCFNHPFNVWMRSSDWNRRPKNISCLAWNIESIQRIIGPYKNSSSSAMLLTSSPAFVAY